MHDDRSHPLLQQTPLTVNPFIDLPKPPTLPHTYASLPSTLPPSAINAAPVPAPSTSTSGPDDHRPAYVTSSSAGAGGFTMATHPSTIIAQNHALLKSFEKQGVEAEARVREWEAGIQGRELAEKRRKAPGWLDGEQVVLMPEKKKMMGGGGEAQQLLPPSGSLMDGSETEAELELEGARRGDGDRDVEGLGDAMDRAFGRSEMG